MQTYMMLFGSGMNFYGGRGEAVHKTFVKSAGEKSQQRVSKFAKQTAYQYYCMLVSTQASIKFHDYSGDKGITENDDPCVATAFDGVFFGHSGRIGFFVFFLNLFRS